MCKHRNRAILGVLIVTLFVATPANRLLSPQTSIASSAALATRATDGPGGMAALMQSAKLVAGDAVSYGSFGIAVAVSADGATAFVGAPRIQANFTDRGAAYVFTRVGALWIQQQILIPSEAEPGDCFGFAVALSADGATAIIGAPAITLFDDEPNPATNAAYVFTRDGATWTQRQKLTASDTTHGDFYGYAIAISGDGTTAAVGALAKKGGSGAAYVFARGDVWAQQQELTADDGAPRDTFGNAIALSGTGDALVIGAEAKDATTGAAYIFTRDGTTWSQQQKLLASDAAPKDFFGNSVAVSADGTTAVIGAPQHTMGESVRGAAYVFSRGGNGWSQQAQLFAADTITSTGTIAEDEFAYVVALSGTGDTVVIGEYGGAAYSFTRSGTSWSQQQRWASKAPAGFFGSSVAMSAGGSTVLIGAPTEGDMGAVYVYSP